MGLVTAPTEVIPGLDGSISPPFVTVVVTLYNYERYLVDCLASIAAQDYPHFRCIIVDDVSTDSSVERVQSFIAERGLQDRFRLVRHEKNQGQLAAFRTGLGHASGEFLAFVDADDVWRPDFLSRHIEAHLSHQPVAFTSSDQYQINENSELIAGRHTDHHGGGNTCIVKPFQVYSNWWIWGTTSTMVFRRAVLDIIMPPDTEPFRRCADNYICHFANLLGESLLIPNRLGYYRRHGQNLFSSNRIIGGDAQPTGNMDNHPRHEAIRCTIREVLLSHPEGFKSVLGRKVLARSLALTLTLPETLVLFFSWLRGTACRGFNYPFMLTLLVRNTLYRLQWHWYSRLLLPWKPKILAQPPRLPENQK